MASDDLAELKTRLGIFTPQPESGGRDAEAGTKDAGHVFGVLESGALGDFGQGEFGFEEELLRDFEPVVNEFFVDAATE